jgi:hypothetical protein
LVSAVGLLAAAALALAPWLPPPIGVRTSLGCAFLASAPLWVTSGRRLVGFVLGLSGVVAWCFLLPFAAHRARVREPFAHAGAVLARQLAARGAGELGSLLHVPSALLLRAGVLPRGDELARREPSAPWLLMEEDAAPQDAWRHVARTRLPPPEYVPRLRLQLPRVALLLLERR